MSFLNEVAGQIKDLLSADISIKDINFVLSGSTDLTPSLKDKIYVGIGVRSVKLSEGAFSSYLGVKSSDELYGKLADIKVGLSIYSPLKFGGSKCYDIFSKAYEILFLSRDSDLEINTISCGQIKYDATTFCYTLDCEIIMRAFIGFKGDDTPVGDIVIRYKREESGT